MSKPCLPALMAVLFAVGGTAQAVSPANRQRVPVDASACGAVPAQLAAAAAAIVGRDWPGYRPYLCLYPVRAPDGKVSLYVLALDVPRADRAHALAWRHGKPVAADDVGGDIDPMPLPAVISRDGRWLATLPRPFPADPPATMSVSFSEWLGGFPTRIDLRIDDPTQDIAARPPYCPPALLWDRRTGRFVETPGKFYASCPR